MATLVTKNLVGKIEVEALTQQIVEVDQAINDDSIDRISYLT